MAYLIDLKVQQKNLHRYKTISNLPNEQPSVRMCIDLLNRLVSLGLPEEKDNYPQAGISFT